LHKCANKNVLYNGAVKRFILIGWRKPRCAVIFQ